MWDQDEMSAGYDAAIADYGAPAPVVELAVIGNVLYIALKGSDRALLAEYSYTIDGVLTRVGG